MKSRKCSFQTSIKLRFLFQNENAEMNKTNVSCSQMNEKRKVSWRNDNCLKMLFQNNRPFFKNSKTKCRFKWWHSILWPDQVKKEEYKQNQTDWDKLKFQNQAKNQSHNDCRSLPVEDRATLSLGLTPEQSDRRLIVAP